MTTKQLLSSNSYIQYPRFLGYYTGVNEAVLLSALCDRDSWCEFNIADYDGWFYYLREDILFDTGLSDRQQRTAIDNLISMKIIDTKRSGIPARIYYKVITDELEKVLNFAINDYKAHKSQMLQNVTSRPDKTVTTRCDKIAVSTIDKNKDIKINKKSTGAGASSKISHSRGFRRERQSLEDKLFSGEEIASQKKERKKSPKDKFRDECLDIIDKEYSDETKELLIEYFNFVTKVPEDKDNLCKRVKTTKAWRHKLDRLDELVKDGYDCKKIIQQSLDKKQYVFYPLQSVSKSNRHESLANDVVVSDPEWARKAIQEAIDNGEEFY